MRRAIVIRRRGITLLEVIIAIALILALLAAMFGFFWNLLAARERLITHAAQDRAADLLIDHLERDLQTVLVGDQTLGSGLAGDSMSIRILTRSVPARLAGTRASATHALADAERTSYRFNEGAHRVEVAHSVPGAAASSSSSSSSSSPLTLEGDIYRIRFRYHDGNAWVDSFDALAADRLPRAVEIAVWFDRWPGDEEENAPADGEAGMDETSGGVPAGGFDERAFALSSDLDLREEPLPDRLRVIAIPDAISADESPASGGME